MVKRNELGYPVIEVAVHPWLWSYLGHNKRAVEKMFNACVQNHMDASWDKLADSMDGLKEQMSGLLELKKKKIELLKIIGDE